MSKEATAEATYGRSGLEIRLHNLSATWAWPDGLASQGSVHFAVTCSQGSCVNSTTCHSLIQWAAYEAILLFIYFPSPGRIMWTPSAEGKHGHVTFLADEMWTDLPCAALGRTRRVSEGSAQSPVSLPWQLITFQAVPAPSAWAPDTGQWQSTIEGEHREIWTKPLRLGDCYSGTAELNLTDKGPFKFRKNLHNLLLHTCSVKHSYVAYVIDLL